MNGRLYDIVMAPLERLGLARRRGRLLSDLAQPVLEVGAGTGLNLPHYSAAASVIATDPQLSMLARARRRRGPRHRLVCARAEAMPFRDGAFAAVVGSFVFCTVDDPRRGLAEVRRLLAQDGELRLLEHVRWTRHPWLAGIQAALTPAWRLVADGCHLDRDTLALVESAGFLIGWLRDDADGLVIELSARPRRSGADAQPAR